LGKAAKPYTKDILALLKDKNVNIDIRTTVVYILGDLGEATKPYIKEIFGLIKNETVDSGVRNGLVSSLDNLKEVIKPNILEIFTLLKDKKIESSVRENLMRQLVNFGEVIKPYTKDVLDLFKDKNVEYAIHKYGASVFLHIDKLNLNQITVILDNIYYAENPSELAGWRGLAYVMSGGSDEAKTLLKWLGKPEKLPEQISFDEAKKTLELLNKAQESTQDLPKLRADITEKIKLVSQKVS
jgi:hypothetical protein